MGGYATTAISLDSYTGNYNITLHRLQFPVSEDRWTTWNPGIRSDRQVNLPLRSDGLPDRGSQPR